MFTLALLKYVKIRNQILFLCRLYSINGCNVKRATHATSFSMFHLDYTFWKCTSLMKCIPSIPRAHIGNKGDNRREFVCLEILGIKNGGVQNVNLILLLKTRQWMKGYIGANIPLLFPCSS